MMRTRASLLTLLCWFAWASEPVVWGAGIEVDRDDLTRFEELLSSLEVRLGKVGAEQKSVIEPRDASVDNFEKSYERIEQRERKKAGLLTPEEIEHITALQKEARSICLKPE